MTHPIDRRNFLGQTARTSVASVGLATVAARTGRASSSEDQRVTLGVMGLSRGKALARQFAQLRGVEVKYVCDVDRERAAQGAKAVQDVARLGPQAITDFRAILDDPQVDALVCAAPCRSINC